MARGRSQRWRVSRNRRAIGPQGGHRAGFATALPAGSGARCPRGPISPCTTYANGVGKIAEGAYSSIGCGRGRSSPRLCHKIARKSDTAPERLSANGDAGDGECGTTSRLSQNDSNRPFAQVLSCKPQNHNFLLLLDNCVPCRLLEPPMGPLPRPRGTLAADGCCFSSTR
jgi:hypothetical protein